MRPIDADALTKDLTCDFAGNPLHGNMKTSMGNIRAMILAQPTIEAVPVVRCRDCTHYREHRTKRYKQLIRQCVRMARHDMEYTVNPDDFCSYGKRKEDDHEVSE